MSPTISNVQNYLVPASGLTHAVNFSQIFGAAIAVDWRQFVIDNFPFIAQGVFIDNTQGTTSFTITINPVNYTITIPAGSSGQYQFPAYSDQTCILNGTGQVTVIFVDFPVMPGIFGTASSAVDFATPQKIILDSVTGGVLVDTNISSITAGVVLPVDFAAPQDIILNSITPGVVLSTTINQKTLTPEYGSILPAALSVTIAPPANTNLLGIEISVSENATLAVAGTDLLTITLNGVIIAKHNPFFPAIAITGLGNIRLFYKDFLSAAPNAGATGTLVVSLATALASGIIDVNAYFGV